jgi:hypothetical protein
MRKTFVIGFMGVVLMGGFLTGLYLINQPTNPASSASEVVAPVVPPGVNVASSSATSGGGFTLQHCEPLYGKTSTDSGFDVVCDMDNNGVINVLDLQKMR